MNPYKIRKTNKRSNIVFKDVKEFNIIFLILISLFLVGISGYSSYAIFSDEIVSNNEIKGIVKKLVGTDTIIKKVGKDGLVKEEHPATEQLAATTDYRYTGKDPNNYIKFNDELWRIIGVFETDDGTGKLEKRIKIIRESLGGIAWDSNLVNDWTTATGMTLLNTGDYYNRTGSYASNGLTEEAKSQIADAKWYLGGTVNYKSASNGLASHWYGYERGTTVYNGRPTSWVGKVGLMYLSDYGYATSGGSTTNRDACLAKEMYNWNSSEVSDCKNNDWLDSSNVQWTLVPYSDDYLVAFHVGGTRSVGSNTVGLAFAFRPCVNLSSDIQITGGSGTSIDPYTLPELATKALINKVGTDGLVAESHPATTQLQATTDYRYTGKNPNNYIKFNDEVWRIIGVFDTDDGTGKLEKRIKLIRNGSIGNIAWDSNDINDWTKATGMTLLNSGDYWNRTGSYASNGLTADAKSLIADAKWYLGGTNQYNTAITTQFYSYERDVSVANSHPTSWTGKVGLMYPSDYGYATSGGTTTNRTKCLETELNKWSDSSVSDCKNNDWLLYENNIAILTPSTRSKNHLIFIYNGHIGGTVAPNVKTAKSFIPCIYLQSDIKITGGSGTSASPYEISK